MSEKEVLIKVEHLSKKFCKDLKTSLWYGVKDLFNNVLGNKNENSLRYNEFWAVKDINFELRRGECLGLIGHNGAGKSTLLKILNGLINPDEGKVTIKGRVGALIELGAGFNPILTGRENIYNNGAILGLSKIEIETKLDEIIDFAEIREFIDMPVQNYSSGMQVRLGFAVAAQMKPDVLIIDEVLAVGDLGFILKCFKQIDQLLPHTAVVFVSHSMPMVARVSNQILLMEKGIAVFQGKEVSKGINSYYNRFNSNEKSIMFDDGTVSLIKYSTNKNNTTLQRGDDLTIELEMEFKEESFNIPLIYIEFRDKEQRSIAGIFNEKMSCELANDKLVVEIKIPKVLFAQGIYTYDLSVNHFENKSPILRINNVDIFQIESETEMWVPFHLEADWQITGKAND
ncbi:ABC transporter ATP-binding protein [Flavobacterium sp. JAS]|uniref:ABC transporter ATP-binding protein n=1 Tax=Flavobacterium sp. JAS TaxID=2897329 RepID=UPI001E3DDBB8|nr:ABC transporter ATP-binding protein [Flavobacterium sp. JAS]MCD0471076.1 ATP-binding cassette domain-containing protein [Flavobacterium sp. JAS]